MRNNPTESNVSRRTLLGTVGKAAAASAVLTPAIPHAFVSLARAAEDAPLNGVAGVDRVTVLPGRTYLIGWAGYGNPPAPPRRGQARDPVPPPPQTGPAPTATWSKQSGPGEVTFADPESLVTTATFPDVGDYVLKLMVDNGETTASSTLNVTVEAPPPARQLGPVTTKHYRIDNPLWSARAKALMVGWIPHCIDLINRTDLTVGAGGIDNFVEAAKALRGEPHGIHKGRVFSNAWIHQTVEAMSIALMIDPKGDPDIIKAHEKMRATLDDWIPKILAAQQPDGYLQTAITLPARVDRGRRTEGPFKRWDRRDDHEGYTAGYFLESAISHYIMTNKEDARLYDAAKKLADCWYDNLGPPPKKAWSPGHQGIEQALVRFAHLVNETERADNGQKYIELARFLLDNRHGIPEGRQYDQSHLPVIQQYEAVGHAVRAAYNYSAMADIAMETDDLDYQSAVRSLWDNIVNRKYYLTGGIGSGETSEGFGPNYSLGNHCYCESCSSCGLIFFQWKMNLTYHDAKYADLYEETLYNALLGATDLEGTNFYYENPLEEDATRAPWHNCPCCVGNIPRTLLMLPTWIYARSADSIFVNLFIGSTVTVEDVAGTDVEMVQVTDYPWNGKVSITVNPEAQKNFSVKIRVPNRDVSGLYEATPDADGITSIAVNGSEVKPTLDRGYAVVTRDWQAGDKIDLTLPLRVQRVRAIDKIEADRGKVALRYGPLVYNIERVDQDITKILSPDSALASEWKEDLLGGVMVIKGTFSDGSAMIAVPHFARMNRGPGSPPTIAEFEAGSGTSAGRAPAPPTSIVWFREA